MGMNSTEEKIREIAREVSKATEPVIKEAKKVAEPYFKDFKGKAEPVYSEVKTKAEPYLKDIKEKDNIELVLKSNITKLNGKDKLESIDLKNENEENLHHNNATSHRCFFEGQ